MRKIGRDAPAASRQGLCRHSLYCLLITAASASGASAYDGYPAGPWHGFPWYGYGNDGPAAYSLGNIPAAPYFALHPPVYYSHPTPRSYGHSPFAHSGNHRAPGRFVPARPIVNPFFQVIPADPKTAPPAEQEKPVKVTVAPRRMVNPYYAPKAPPAVVVSRDTR